MTATSVAETTRRKHCAYWFAVGVYEEQVRVFRASLDQSTPAPVDFSQAFSEYVEEQARAYYAEETFHMHSVPGQWEQFVEEMKQFSWPRLPKWKGWG